MLQVIIPGMEYWDEKNEEFINTNPQTIQLEHSLVSISKWESRWQKTFLSNNNKTTDEIMDYIRCMTITQNVQSDVYTRLTPENIDSINSYIDEPMTATRIPIIKNSVGAKDSLTSEIIYYWMISLNIPLKCEKWHLNRLLTLIRVCDFKNNPPKKRSQRELLSQNAALNAARRKQLNTKG